MSHPRDFHPDAREYRKLFGLAYKQARAVAGLAPDDPMRAQSREGLQQTLDRASRIGLGGAIHKNLGLDELGIEKPQDFLRSREASGGRIVSSGYETEVARHLVREFIKHPGQEIGGGQTDAPGELGKVLKQAQPFVSNRGGFQYWPAFQKAVETVSDGKIQLTKTGFKVAGEAAPAPKPAAPKPAAPAPTPPPSPRVKLPPDARTVIVPSVPDELRSIREPMPRTDWMTYKREPDDPESLKRYKDDQAQQRMIHSGAKNRLTNFRRDIAAFQEDFYHALRTGVEETHKGTYKLPLLGGEKKRLRSQFVAGKKDRQGHTIGPAGNVRRLVGLKLGVNQPTVASAILGRATDSYLGEYDKVSNLMHEALKAEQTATNPKAREYTRQKAAETMEVARNKITQRVEGWITKQSVEGASVAGQLRLRGFGLISPQQERELDKVRQSGTGRISLQARLKDRAAFEERGSLKPVEGVQIRKYGDLAKVHGELIDGEIDNLKKLGTGLRAQSNLATVQAGTFDLMDEYYNDLARKAKRGISDPEVAKRLDLTPDERKVMQDKFSKHGYRPFGSKRSIVESTFLEKARGISRTDAFTGASSPVGDSVLREMGKQKYAQRTLNRISDIAVSQLKLQEGGEDPAKLRRAIGDGFDGLARRGLALGVSQRLGMPERLTDALPPVKKEDVIKFGQTHKRYNAAVDAFSRELLDLKIDSARRGMDISTRPELADLRRRITAFSEDDLTPGRTQKNMTDRVEGSIKRMMGEGVTSDAEFARRVRENNILPSTRVISREAGGGARSSMSQVVDGTYRELGGQQQRLGGIRRPQGGFMAAQGLGGGLMMGGMFTGNNEMMMAGLAVEGVAATSMMIPFLKSLGPMITDMGSKIGDLTKGLAGSARNMKLLGAVTSVSSIQFTAFAGVAATATAAVKAFAIASWAMIKANPFVALAAVGVTAGLGIMKATGADHALGFDIPGIGIFHDGGYSDREQLALLDQGEWVLPERDLSALMMSGKKGLGSERRRSF